MLRVLRALLGSNLALDDDPVIVAEGRRLLSEHLAELREAVAAAESARIKPEALRALRADLAKAIANVGQSLQNLAMRHDCDDPKARLEQALSLHNEAMTFPERVADPAEPVGLYHSLRMRGTCQRLLAAHSDDAERQLLLLDGAVADARAAVSLCQRQPEMFPDGGLIVVNLVNAMKDRLSLEFDLGRVDKEEARRRLGDIRVVARGARSDRGEAIGPSLLAQMEAGLDRLAAHLEGVPRAADLDGLARHIIAAFQTLEDWNADPIDPVAALAVIQEIEQLSNIDKLPAFHMNLLGGFFGRLHVDIIGPSLCVRAMMQESRLLSAQDGHPRPLSSNGKTDEWDPIEYVEQGITGLRERMANPVWAHAEKRVSAGWLKLLASARLDWASRGSRPIDILQELRLADLSGSTAWRSNLSFYGAGPTRFSDGPVSTPEGLRLNLYRARFERDMAADHLYWIELSALMERITGISHHPYAVGASYFGANVFSPGTPRDVIRAKTQQPEHTWIETADGIAVPKVGDEGAARMESTQLLAELKQIVGTMVGMGWMEGEWPDIPEATPAHLTDWLSRHRCTAILNVGAGLTPTVVGHDGESIWCERVEAPIALGVLIKAYESARDEHSFGVYDSELGILDTDISDSERELRYQRAIATPAATTKLDQVTRAMLAALGSAFGPSLEAAKSRGVRKLLLLLRGSARHVPWFAVPVGDSLLGDTFAAAVVETLAPVERAIPRHGQTGLYVGGKAGVGSSLSLGKEILAHLSDQTVGPSDRDTFEALAASSSVLRVFAHGTAMMLHTEAGGIEMDEDDQRPVNRYTVSEARMLDLRGARRVELWACESGRSDSFYSDFVFHDEPTGMDAAVLLAGAECAVSSLWTQYVLSSAMLAEAFTLELAAQPRAEAAALSAAIRRYREGMGEGGVFTLAVRRHIEGSTAPLRVESALRTGLDAWRSHAWSDLLGRAPPPLKEGVALDGMRLGPSKADRRVLAGRGAEQVEHILAPYRSPLAWAGWRVTLRSIDVFDPLPASVS
ncbi:CHAT domain-containing protein [Myxococcota bacterium]|nr:CHAT domain-containing protein [Myxococcota bacterium]